MGNRVTKRILNIDNEQTDKTFYTRDAQGNVLSIYENGKQKTYRDDNGNIYYFNAQNELINYTDATGKNLFTFNIKGKLIFEKGQAFVCIDKINWGNCNDKIQLTDITDENLITQTEVPIYGSDRIGTYNPQEETNINSDIYILNRSYKRYELKDHLGNVRVTVSDSKRVSFVSETLVFSAEIKTYTDYYAFGMEMVSRNWSEGDAYRQGYNGKENDKDFGEGVQDYGMRVSDTQTCRFFSVDPITAQYPELTPYQFASNTPIQAIDLDGLEMWLVHGTWDSPKTWETLLKVTNNLQTLKEATGTTKIIDNFEWGGLNTSEDRSKGALKLVKEMRAYIDSEKFDANVPIVLMGHSHGGNISIEAINMLEQYGDLKQKNVKIHLITINTPVRNDYVPTTSSVLKSHTNVYDVNDDVQAIGGKGNDIPAMDVQVGNETVHVHRGEKLSRIIESSSFFQRRYRDYNYWTGETGPAGRKFEKATNIEFDRNPSKGALVSAFIGMFTSQSLGMRLYNAGSAISQTYKFYTDQFHNGHQDSGVIKKWMKVCVDKIKAD